MARWLSGLGRWLVIERSRVRLPACPLPSNTHVPLSPSSIIWYRPKGGDALQPGRLRHMRHRLCGPSTYGLNGLEREMSTPPTLRRGTADFTFFRWSRMCAEPFKTTSTLPCQVVIFTDRSTYTLTMGVFRVWQYRLVEQGLTSHATQFRSFRRRCCYRSDDTTNSVKAL